MDGQLNKHLLIKEEEFRGSLPAEHEILMKSIDYLKQSGIANGLQAGDTAPDFTLKDSLGAPVSLSEYIAKGPVILTFYRGSWCPFCNLQLRAYQEMLPQFKSTGANLIAVSPQKPEDSISRQEKEELPFAVVCDTNGSVADQFKLRYEVSSSLRELYEKLAINLDEYNANGQWFLPVSATFVIDRNSVIRYAYVDPNFMRRLEPEIIMNVLSLL
ncbi:Peroxiredoxin Bcp [Paenibacillus solanacearum]|uniref:thioredoxin-dependent peroxiredoxin n=1 Tax=Paenibacillus solanacearum TaxID=2048548 RepID=A0A916NYL6_9BACL|nr:peroxiredoxin-like family protein [Paenibacillus solanacearum]CAG7646820.1 Peroxiredoxin Bcp [Paenibacillus solanacearum]